MSLFKKKDLPHVYKSGVIVVICVLLIMTMTACGSDDNNYVKTKSKAKTVNDVLELGMAEADSKSVTEEQEEEQPTEQSEDQPGVQPEEQSNTVRQSGINENAPEPEPRDEILSTTDGIDIDLTALSSTMVYSEVYNMMVSPDDYIGKTIKMDGQFVSYHDESTDKYYYSCIISDATACCSQGLEFELTDEYTYPDDYPEDGGEICVVGTFDTYQEGAYKFCTLRDARIA